MSSASVPDEIEFFEERAAIREFDGGQARANAESGALRETAERYGKPASKRVDQWRKSKEEGECL